MKLLKRALLAAPILLLTGVAACTYYQRSRIDALLQDPNNLVWGSDGSRLRVVVDETREGVLSSFSIRVLKQDGSIAHAAEFEVDWDAGLAGGGFVRAIQADADPELEVVAWAANASQEQVRRPFLLDHDRGAVARKPYDAASAQARQQADDWLQYHVVRKLETTILIVLTVFYYVLFGLVAGLIALLRRFRRRGAES